MALIDRLEVWTHLNLTAATGFDDVLASVVNLVHFHRHVVKHTEGLCHRVVGKWINHHVLSAEVTDNVWFIHVEILCREELVLIIAFAVCVRHCFGIDATREVAFRRSDVNTFEVHVFGIDDTYVHAGLVANHNRDTGHRHVRLSRFGCTYRFRNSYYFSLTFRRCNRNGVESWDLHVNLNAFLRRGDKLRAECLRVFAQDVCPFRSTFLLCHKVCA